MSLSVSSADVSYFERVEALLRRSIGVSLTAKGSAFIRPAPPTAMGPIDEEGVRETDESFVNQGQFGDPSEWMDWQSMKEEMGSDIHDEL